MAIKTLQTTLPDTGEPAEFEYDDEAVDKNLGRPLTPEEAQLVFKHNYSTQQANPTVIPGAAAPVPGRPSTGLMNPNEPSTWDTIADTAKGLASGLPKAAGQIGNFVSNEVPMGLKAALEHLFTGKTSPETIEKYQRRANRISDIAGSVGGDYVPETRLGQDAQAAGTGAASALLTGGRNIPELVVGALGGAAENEAGRDTGNNGLIEAGVGAAPIAALGLKRQVFSPASAFHSAREALDNMHPGEVADLLANEANANAAGVKPMVWQSAPPQSAIRNVGQGSSMLPQAEQTQANLRDLWGGQQGQHAAADQVAVNNLLNPSPIENTLRQTDALRGANMTGKPDFSAEASHGTGDMALALQALEHVVPHLTGPVEAMLGSASFAKLGAFNRMRSGPAQRAADELASQTNFGDFQKLARTDPRLQVYKNYLQAAFMPVAEGNLPQTPLDKQQ